MWHLSHVQKLLHIKQQISNPTFTITRFIGNVVTRPEAAGKHEMQYCLTLDIKNYLWGENLKRKGGGKLVERETLEK